MRKVSYGVYIRRCRDNPVGLIMEACAAYDFIRKFVRTDVRGVVI